MNSQAQHLIDDAARRVAPWIADERAVTAIEYGLLAALIAVGILGALTATGTSLTQIYDFWSAAVVAAL